MDSRDVLLFRYKNEYPQDPERFSLSGTAPGGQCFRMRPFQASDRFISAQDVSLLAEWRNQHRGRFLTEFTATPQQTRRWLTGTIGPDPTRILFMLDDEAGIPFGHVGLCNVDLGRGFAEIDNVLRGGGGPRGAMSAAMRALIAWAEQVLGIHDISLRVLSDNPAIDFYDRLGFVPVRDVALRRVEGPGFVRWCETEGSCNSTGSPASRYVRYMSLPRKPDLDDR